MEFENIVFERFNKYKALELKTGYQFIQQKSSSLASLEQIHGARAQDSIRQVSSSLAAPDTDPFSDGCRRWVTRRAGCIIWAVAAEWPAQAAADGSDDSQLSQPRKFGL